jgi:hypothetical protein
MYEYYDCGKLTKDIYEDKMVEIANKSVELQTLLVEFSCDRGYGKDASKWKNHYKLNINISRYEEIDLSHSKPTQEVESFYKLPVDASKIIFVDTRELFDKMFESFKKHKTVGLDCEQQISNDLSIIQIATKDEVFVIDAMNMRNDFDWKKLADEFFNSYKIKKLGCGILNDLTTISKFLAIKIDKNASYIDLGLLSEKAMEVKTFKFPFEEEKRSETRPGLSKLTKLCLGSSLNKAYAVSNWSQRPLREEQLSYAALDAFVATEIFDKINEILSKLEFAFEDIYYEKKDDCKGKKKPK